MRDKVIQAIQIHRELLDQFESAGIDTVIEIATIIIESFQNGGTLYLCGNGGSAADCQHIAGEMTGRFKAERKALPAVALSTDTSVITCLGNDYGFDNIFVRQVEGLVKSNDVLWAFSTSGSSVNVIKAVKLAKEKNAKIVTFTGKADSELEKLSDICLCIGSDYASDAQEIHQLAYHIICGLIEVSMKD